MSNYPLSDKFIAWASGLSAYCTDIKNAHGSITDLVEDKKWDGDKTILVLTLLNGLKTSVANMEKELRHHVDSKY